MQVRELMLAGEGRHEIAATLEISLTSADQYMWSVRKASGDTHPHNWRVNVVDLDDTPPRVVRARISADIAAGRRCPRCHLLLPCDHQ